MSLLMTLVQLSLCVLAVTQTSSSQRAAKHEIDRSCARSDQLMLLQREVMRALSLEVMTALTQLQRDVDVIKKTILHHKHGPEEWPPEGPIKPTPGPETTPETTTPEPTTTTTTEPTTTPEPTTTTEPKPGKLGRPLQQVKSSSKGQRFLSPQEANDTTPPKFHPSSLLPFLASPSFPCVPFPFHL